MWMRIQLTCLLPRDHQVYGNVYYICLCQARIMLLTLVLKQEETSPEVQNGGINGPTNKDLCHPRIFTVRNEVAKVMFLQLSVCPQWGVCLSASWDTHPPTRTRYPPPDQAPPKDQASPQETATAADGTHPTGMHSCFKKLL